MKFATIGCYLLNFFINIESRVVVTIQFFFGAVLGWITEDFGGEAELKDYLKRKLEQLTGMIVNRIVLFALDGPPQTLLMKGLT
jgi:hypothetical protein